MIDVKKNQRALKKGKEKDIDIRNEMKIITASKNVYELWSKLISSHSQGELTDPKPLLKFRQMKGWEQEKDGVMTREFFKHRGNFSKDDLRQLALHLLERTPKRTFSHQKVTIKQVRSVLEDCYSAKEWLERCKRK